jgi:integrase
VQLLLLTGTRRDEMREAPGKEFELVGTAIPLPTGSAWRGPLWSLPGARTKNGRDHLVPLSPLAVEKLKSIPNIRGKGFLFTTTGETPISGLSKAKERLHAAMLAELRKDDPHYNLEPWSPHDLRRTFYSGLQRLGFSIEIAEACVNHTGGTLRGVAKVYGRYQYLAEKTAALDAWARHIEALVSGAPSNVVSLHGGR